MKPKPFFFQLARRHGSRRFRHNRCVDSTPATQARCFPPPESPTTRMPGHPPPCLAILNWRMSTMPINVLRPLAISDLSPCPRGTYQVSIRALHFPDETASGLCTIYTTVMAKPTRTMASGQPKKKCVSFMQNYKSERKIACVA